MKKKQMSITAPSALFYRLAVKFKNMLERVDNLLFTGKFWEFTQKQQQQVASKLNALYAKLAALNHPLALKVAGAATCFLLFAGNVDAQTASFGKLTGALSPINFTELTDVGSSGSFQDGVFADIDGDGDLDLCLMLSYKKVAYFENNNGQFTENDAENPFANVDSYSIVGLDIVDIDNDGALDLVTVNYSDSNGSGNIITHYELNATSGTFELVPDADSDINATKKLAIKPYNNSTIKFFDVNGDGLLDMVSYGTYMGEQMGTFIQQADHSFAGIQLDMLVITNDFDAMNYFAFADLNRDGKKDLIIQGFTYDNYTDSTYYYTNNGNGTFTQITETSNIPLPQLSHKSIVIFGDINNDSQTDIFQPGDQGYNVSNNNQAVFLNTTIPLPVALEEYQQMYFDKYPYTVTPASLLANDALKHTKGKLVAKIISSSNGGVITANGINYSDTLTDEVCHRVKYRVGNALAPGDTLWGNTIESSIFPFPLRITMVSDSTGNLPIKLSPALDFSAIAIYNNDTLKLRLLAGITKKMAPQLYILPDYTAGDTIKIYGYGINYLFADSIKLKHLDVTRNPGMIGLSCIDNNLTFLDLSNNNNLSKLDCSNNRLYSVMMPPSANSMEMEISNNRLKTITVATDVALLNISNNLLDTLDVSNATELVGLICSSNNLKQLTLGRNENLQGLLCDNNQLTELNLSGVPNLSSLDCQNNRLSSLVVNDKPNLFYLYCQNNSLNLRTLPQNNSQYVEDPTYKMGGYKYAPQKDMQASEIDAKIDLSNQVSAIDLLDITHTTQFKWFTKDGTEVPANYYTSEKGVFSFVRNPADSVYCVMYNEAFPDLKDKNSFRTNLIKIGKIVYNPEILWKAPEDIVYGTPLSDKQLNAVAVFDGKTVSGTFEYTPKLGNVLNAGTDYKLSVKFIPAETADYSAASQTTSVNVSKATLTATAESKTKVYGEANPELTVSYSGFVNTETESVLDEAVVVSTHADAASPVGVYVLSLNKAVDDNYEIVPVDGELAVTKAKLTVTADNKTAIKGTEIPALTVTYSGFVNGNDASVLKAKPVASTSATIGSEAGAYDIVIANGADDNYEFVYVNGSLNITEKQVPSVKWEIPSASAIVYGAPLSASQLNASAPIEGTFEYAPALGTVLNAGTHTLTVVFTPADAANYKPVTVTSSVTIAKAKLTVTADNKTAIKGTEIPALTVTYSGFVNGNDASVLKTKPVASTSATIGSEAGAYDIVIANGADDNYEFVYVNGSLTVQATSVNIDDISAKVSIYPIPVSDILTIELPEVSDNASVSITALNGTKALVCGLSNIANNIDVSELADGFYLVNITIDGKSTVVKLEKK